jgi:hypothetical protein
MSASNTNTTASTISLDIEKKISEITADLQPWYANKLFSISPKQAMTVVALVHRPETLSDHNSLVSDV